jgi:hypothetical protein
MSERRSGDPYRDDAREIQQANMDARARGEYSRNDVVIGVTLAGLAAAVAAGGFAGEARAATPTDIQKTGTAVETQQNVPLKPKDLIVDLSKTLQPRTPRR